MHNDTNNNNNKYQSASSHSIKYSNVATAHARLSGTNNYSSAVGWEQQINLQFYIPSYNTGGTGRQREKGRQIDR